MSQGFNLHQHKKFRENGTIGALLDEYERAISELINVIDSVDDHHLHVTVDHETEDKNCVSIQSILTHVVQSGHTYVVEIRKWMGEPAQYRDKILLNTSAEYERALKEMFSANEKLFEDYPNIMLTIKDSSKKMTTRWGQQYDVDQLMAHAIVHVLKHRRQIERFIKKCNDL